MVVRLLRKEDLLQSRKISAVAYEYSSDLKIDPDNYKEGKDWGAYEGDDPENPGKLFAQMVVHNHVMSFDGHWVNSGGIAGVSTLPEYRRKGGIRKIFEAVYSEMRKKGQIFSSLYPFSHEYYNKFGYQTVGQALQLTFGFQYLEKFEINTRCTLAENRENEDIKNLYLEYAITHNTALNGDSANWGRIPENPYQNKRYAYIYYRENGTPGGYFIYEPSDCDEGRLFKVTELIYKTPDDLMGIFGFMRVFSSQYAKIEIAKIPVDEDFSFMFANQYDISKRLSFYCMASVVDVEKALLLMKYPKEPGSFSIKVNDSFAEWNNYIFDVNFDGKNVNVTKRSDGEYDVETLICTLARLILGTDNILSPSMAFSEGLKVFKNHDILKNVFIKKPIYIIDAF